jgi:hypothetical protein
VDINKQTLYRNFEEELYDKDKHFNNGDGDEEEAQTHHPPEEKLEEDEEPPVVEGEEIELLSLRELKKQMRKK